MAIKMVGADLHISIPKKSKKAELIWLESKQASFIGENDKFSRDDEDELIEAISKVERIRYLHPINVPLSVYEKLAPSARYVACEPFVSHGRLELMHYFVEQSVSNSYHRYGNLGIQGISLKEI
jgi:RHH-type proline utilization regulon transcriptional repressor/proline dehydrogenase/delta 1-pyrroline-5-carboxylate dehydrogenase